MRKILSILTFFALSLSDTFGYSPIVAYDIDRAKEICSDIPLESVEGIWIYPDDMVSVLILADNDRNNNNSFNKYTISVVESSDTRLRPGDIIGSLTATPEERTFSIELVTERKNDLLLKPKTCLATLSKEGDSFVFKKQKTGIKTRLNINFNRLLPGFWKIVSAGISSGSNSANAQPATGMIKIYPSYDGNGSSRRKPRYL